MAASAVIVAILVGGADITSIQQLLEQAQDYHRSGASISILTAEGRIDGDRCDRLTGMPGVRASGALRTTTKQLKPVVLPRSPIPVSDASPGFVAVIGAEVRTPGVLLGPEASKALGLSGQGSIPTSETRVRVAATYAYPDDGRRPGFSYAAIAPTNSAGTFDECWVDTWPAKDMTTALLSTMHVSSDKSKQPAIAQLNPTRGKSFDGNVLFQQRITRCAGACTALGGFVLGLVGVRTRRLSLASALHAGVSRRALLAIVTLEALALVLLSAALIVPIAVLAASTLNGGVSATLVPGLSAAVPLWLGAFAGASLGVTTIKEKHLFRYFKTR
ncbi:hypothetical protein G3T36_05795 [Diaminobutyricibacter tongyongensis]|uniref:ABC transporter permease n=1 Tax=Leifsonia tongyongensis TaxID=1268043 RepID=A0A6L9XVC3_9MICO|nr:hypothetical protein [Diaminobutyricibacter tongyongensis]NEN05380.1 hypothetical protein [Diaminobutyricibacter tongyongensis]